MSAVVRFDEMRRAGNIVLDVLEPVRSDRGNITTDADFGFGVDLATAAFDDDVEGDREALAGAATDFFGCEERLEHSTANFVWNSAAVV